MTRITPFTWACRECKTNPHAYLNQVFWMSLNRLDGTWYVQHPEVFHCDTLVAGFACEACAAAHELKGGEIRPDVYGPVYPPPRAAL